jgi:2-polyprenyl-3-methyl-5-hydroxy-6-metoxy-1,4-benzoquinol methylase
VHNFSTYEQFFFFNRSTTHLKQEWNWLQQSTVDEADIKHFSELASRWWDEGGVMKGLHSLNKLR